MTYTYPTLDPETIVSLLAGRFPTPLLSLRDLPPPDQLKDMQRAVERIVHAAHHREHIVLIGDYDVDGVMATALVVQFFSAINVPVTPLIPNRFSDGYGLSPGVMDRIADADVIITVDNGIAATEAAHICLDRGIDLIITDHHIVPKVPPKAYAIINPKQPECSFPYPEICGAQIAWYLCAAVNRAMQTGIDMKRYLDMVAIAIVADMMPLQHINRMMVQAGLQQFGRSKWPFIAAWKELHPKHAYTSEDLAFSFAPMINSAGRLEDASIALEYLLASNIDDARNGYAQLKTLNEERKRLEQTVTHAAAAQVDPQSSVIVVNGEGWHEGVVGIVAARLVRRFGRPAIVLSQKGAVCTGSGRSWRECHLYNLLARQQNRMLKFGGHKAAIGMSIHRKELDAFSDLIQHHADADCREENQNDPDILGHLPFEYITLSLLQRIARFEPFGQENPKPKFITTNVTIAAVQQMGKEKNHLRFTLESRGHYRQAVQFKTTAIHTRGDRVDVVYTLTINHFRGEQTIQLMIDRITNRTQA